MREILILNEGWPVFEDKYKQSNKPIGKLIELCDRTISIEICPNRKFNTKLLSNLDINFCSVTWRPKKYSFFEKFEAVPTVILAKQLRFHGYNVMLHLAGRNLRRYQVLEILTIAKNYQVRNVLALRGDDLQSLEKDDSKCDFPYAADLVKFIRSYFGDYFSIGVAGYPEKYMKNTNMMEEIEYLKYKVACGADFIITQASYDYKAYESFAVACKRYNIDVPIIPGVLIVSSYKQLAALSNFCGVPINVNVFNIVYKNRKNSEAVKEYSIFQATESIKTILMRTDLFRGVHIFSLNNIELAGAIMKRLGMYQTVIERPLALCDMNSIGVRFVNDRNL